MARRLPRIAHPGKHDPHIVKRYAQDIMAAHAKRSLNACENTSQARELSRKAYPVARKPSSSPEARITANGLGS